MPSITLYLQGLAKWVKAQRPDDTYKNYTLDLYMTDSSKEVYNQSGLQMATKNTPSDDSNEPTGDFITFRRPDVKAIKGELVEFGPPEVLNADNTPFPSDKLIGNGSLVTIKVTAYDSRQGKGHRLESIRVEDLIEYDNGSTLLMAEDVNAPF